MDSTKSVVLALALAFAPLATEAQTAMVEYKYNGMYQFMPQSMSADGEVRLVTKSIEGSKGTARVNLTIYGSNFEEEKVISNPVRVTSTGNTRTKSATRAIISQADTTDITNQIENIATPDDKDEKVTAEDLMTYANYMGSDLATTADGYYYDKRYSYRFYGDTVFGERYPYQFVTLKDGRAYSIYVIKYTPDFTDAQWTTSSWTDYESDMVRTFRLHNLDEDEGYSQSQSLILTQSLFNDDDKYEYIRTMRKAGASGSDGYSSVSPDTGETPPQQTEVTDNVSYGICGYEVVNEDGIVVYTIAIDDEDVTYFTEGSSNENIMVVKMNGELYFIVTTESNSTSKMNKLLVYKLDKETSSAKRIVTSKDILISPTFVKDSQPVTITFKQPTSSRVCVTVTSLEGRVVAKRVVEAGTAAVDISTSGMAKGMYNFSVWGQGHVLENGKVLVR